MKMIVFLLLVAVFAPVITLPASSPAYALMTVHTPGNYRPAGKIFFSPTVGPPPNIEFATYSTLQLGSDDDLYVALSYDAIDYKDCFPYGPPDSVEKDGFVQPMVLFYLRHTFGKPDNYLLSPNSKASLDSRTHNVVHQGIILYRVQTFLTPEFLGLMDWQTRRPAAACGVVELDLPPVFVSPIPKVTLRADGLPLTNSILRFG